MKTMPLTLRECPVELHARLERAAPDHRVALARRLACPLVTQDRDILKFYPAESVSLEDFSHSNV